MESFQEIFRQRQGFFFGRVFDNSPLQTAQKAYLVEVYGILAGTVISTTLGLQIARYIVEIPLLISVACQMACVIYLFSTRGGYHTFKDPKSLKRMSVLGGLSLFSGCSLAPLVDYANYLHPGILPSALLATTVAFLCFSFAAIFAKERKFLYLGSVLSSVLSYFSLVSLFNIFFASSFAHDVVLYGGLLVYLGFIVFDTQSILYEFSRGTRDPVFHALTFYVDIIGLFVRLMNILIQRHQKDAEENERKRR